MRTSREYAIQQLRVLGVKLGSVSGLALLYHYVWASEVVAWAMVAAVLLCNAKFLQNFFARQAERREPSA